MTIDTNGFNIGDNAWYANYRHGNYEVLSGKIKAIVIKDAYPLSGVKKCFEFNGSSTMILISNTFHTKKEAVEYCAILNKKNTSLQVDLGQVDFDWIYKMKIKFRNENQI